MEKIKIRVSFTVVVFILFAIAALFYLNIDKTPLTHPGNIKAADPFYHVYAVEQILDTRQWNYYDTYISLGENKAASVQPPLFYLDSAILALFSGLPAWVTLYFLVCLSQAFFVIITYLITEELFDNKKIGLLAASLSVLPIPVSSWLYGLYIGFWIQVPAYFFMMCFVYFYIRYMKSKKNIYLLFCSLCASSVLLLHPSDLFIVLVPLIILSFEILSGINNLSKFMKKALLLGFVPGLTFIILLPRFLFLWGGKTRGNLQFGFYGLFRDKFPSSGSGALVWPHISFFPAWILVFFSIGLIVALFMVIKKCKLPELLISKNNFKLKIKHSDNPALFFWLMSLAWFFALIYLGPAILNDPYYISARTRALQPYFILPLVSALIYIIIEFLVNLFQEHRRELVRYGSIMLVCAAAIYSSVPQYQAFTSQVSYEHLSLAEWQAYTWVQANTRKESKFLFFGFVSQSEQLYLKRISAYLETSEIQNMLNTFLQNNATSLDIKIDWTGQTLRDPYKREKSFFSYEDITQPGKNAKIIDFDYIFFQDISPEIANVNRVFASEYIEKLGFKLVYNNLGYFILKNENKKQ